LDLYQERLGAKLSLCPKSTPAGRKLLGKSRLPVFESSWITNLRLNSHQSEIWLIRTMKLKAIAFGYKN
jgi:hypothetical protein